MRLRLFAECGNPQCKETAPLEMPDTWLDDLEMAKLFQRKSGREVLQPPYAWVETTYTFIGSREPITVVTCSMKCALEAGAHEINGGS